MISPIRQSVASTREKIYWPVGKPRGGIVCLHGSEGGWAGWNDLYCALFAANGFAALSRNYTKVVHWPMPPDIDDIPLEGTVLALDAMRAEMAPFGCGVGLFGISRGAEHALLLSQLMVEDHCANIPDAVAVHSPPDVAWPAFLVANFLPGQSGKGLEAGPAWSWHGTHERTRSGTPLCPGTVPYAVFLVQGTEDRTWDAGMARRLVARLIENGCQPEAHFFEGEGHIFRAEAQNREWALMTDFFARHLAIREPSKCAAEPQAAAQSGSL